MNEIKCPHCGTQFLVQADLATALSIAVGNSTYEKPEFVHKGYRFWMRDFLPGMTNTKLVAVCLAWPEKDAPDRRFFSSVVGASAALEYKQGETIGEDLGCVDEFWVANHSLDELKSLKEAAMQRLKEYVDQHVTENVYA